MNTSLVKENQGEENVFDFWKTNGENLFKDFFDLSFFESKSSVVSETYNEKDKVIVEFEIPGYTKDNINIKIDNDVLTVSGQTNEESKEKGKLSKKTRSFSWARTIDSNIFDTENIIGFCKNGILSVTIPKLAEPKKPKSINIEITD